MEIELEDVRISFPHIFKPTQVNGEGPLKYRATFLIKKSDTKQVARIRAAMDKVGQEKWAKDWPRVKAKMEKDDMMCLHDGDEKVDKNGKPLDGYVDHWYINAANDVAPNIKSKNGRERLTAEDGRIYAGARVYAWIDIWAQSNQFGQRVNASLAGIQEFRDAPAFTGGRPTSDDKFRDLSEGDDEPEEDMSDILK